MVARPYKREQSRSHRRRSDVGCHGAAPGKHSPLLQFLEFLGNREDKRHWKIKLVLELGRAGQNPGRGTVARDISTVRHTAWEGRGGGGVASTHTVCTDRQGVSDRGPVPHLRHSATGGRTQCRLSTLVTKMADQPPYYTLICIMYIIKLP